MDSSQRSYGAEETKKGSRTHYIATPPDQGVENSQKWSAEVIAEANAITGDSSSEFQLVEHIRKSTVLRSL